MLWPWKHEAAGRFDLKLLLFPLVNRRPEMLQHLLQFPTSAALDFEAS